MSSWFSQGYDKVEQRDKEIQEALSQTRLQTFRVKESEDDVYISFITAEPITFYEHYVKHLNRAFTCPDNGDATIGNCPFCVMGNKPSFRGAYLIIDHRHEKWQDKQGVDHEQKNTLKVAKFGIRVLKQLQKLDAKLKKGSPTMPPVPTGLLGVVISVTRTGEGTDTAYSFTPFSTNEQSFPRSGYQEKLPTKDGKRLNEIEAVIETVKPLSIEKLKEIMMGKPSSQQQQQNYGQPIQYGQPANFNQAPQPSGQFGFSAPPQPNGGPIPIVIDDDDDVLPF